MQNVSVKEQLDTFCPFLNPITCLEALNHGSMSLKHVVRKSLDDDSALYVTEMTPNVFYSTLELTLKSQQIKQDNVEQQLGSQKVLQKNYCK